jgi:CubicO group peptidase (beta-lactamase class C family)
LAAVEVRLGEHPEHVNLGFARAQTPVTADTVFPIASVTKTFTSALCARRVAEGAWTWDTRVGSIWPGFRLHDADAAARMTLRDVLCHRSGLPPHTWAWVFAKPGRFAFLRDRLPNLESAGKFDEKVRYSNLMYALAGGLLEHAGHATWEEQVRRGIWHPLGMNATRHAESGWLDRFDDVAAPHNAQGPIPPFHAVADHVIAPASEVFSTARDLAAWLGHAMSDQELTGCFEPSSETSGTRPHPELGKLFYGLGWRIESLGGATLVWHSGQCTGYTAWIGFQPKFRRGWVLLSNQDGAIDTLQALSYCLATGEDWLTRLPAPAVAPAVPIGALKPEPAPAGWYDHPGYGEVEIAADGRLRLNESAFGPLGRGADGALVWEIPGYGRRVTADIRETDLTLALESNLAPIRFTRRG